MVKIKLELQKLDDQEFADLLHLVGSKLDGNLLFPNLPIGFDQLSDDADLLATKIAQREALYQQAQQLTLGIHLARDKGEADLNLDTSYIEQVINTIVPPATSVDPVVAAEKARSAGLDVADTPSPVGAMPKITGLAGTQGDSDGEIDLHWNPVKRGLKSYELEMTEDPAGQTGWAHAGICSKSSFTKTGLTSGKRYWFRAAAVGTEGPGPFSEPATKVAP